jgi:HK97 family phage major capsid protein
MPMITRDTLTAEMDEAKAKAKAAMVAAEKENRELTAEERTEIQGHLDAAKAAKAKIDQRDTDEAMRAEIERMTVGAAPQKTPKAQTSPMSLGAQYVASDDYKVAQANAKLRATAWKSPGVELQAATLTTDTASGGDLIVPDYRPGILPLLFKRLTIADLLASGTTDSSSVTYMKESTFTNAAAAVAEGGAKPESTMIFDQVTDLVRKLAHWLPVTDEMLEDVSQIRSYIDARLRLGLELTEEDQLLNGSGSGSNINGLMNRTGLAADQARSSDTSEDAVFKQIWAIFTNSFLMPDGVVMNPANWQTIALRKDTTGQYIFSSPASGSMTAQRLWGIPVVVTPSMTANTALVGAYKQGAQVFRKGGVRVETSNSHADFFTRNLTAILIEERLALAVYRPASFGKVTGLN